jgi:hypothetical protein
VCTVRVDTGIAKTRKGENAKTKQQKPYSTACGSQIAILGWDADLHAFTRLLQFFFAFSLFRVFAIPVSTLR